MRSYVRPYARQFTSPLGARVAGRRFSPLAYSDKLKLWIDPSYSKTTQYGAKFVASQSRYLSTADSADFDCSSTDTFSISFMRSATVRQASSSQTDKGYISHCTTNTGWIIQTGDGTGGQNWVRVLLGSGSGLTGATTTDQSTVGTAWSHCAVVYNKADTEESNKGRCRVYLDGTLVPVATMSAALGDAVGDPSTTLQIGRRGGLNDGYINAVISNVIFWPNTVLTAENVTTLWNSGSPLNYSQLGALQTGVKGAWNLDEASGTRVDASGNGHDMAENNGTIDRAESVLSLTCRFPSSCVFSAQYGHAPFYEASSALGQSLHFMAEHYMRATLPSGFATAAGDWYHNVRFDTSTAQENTILGLSLATPATDFFYTHLFAAGGGDNTFRIRSWGTSPPPNGLVRTTTNTFADDTNYTVDFHGYGSGGADSFDIFVNGAEDTPVLNPTHGSANTISNSWTGSLDAPEELTLGCFRATSVSDVNQGRLDGWIGDTVCYGGSSSITADQSTKIRQWMAGRGSVTLS